MNFKTLKTGLLSALVAGTIYMPVSNAKTSPEIKKTSTEIKKIIIEEAENSRVPAALALAVAKVESNFNEDALSPVGARGVMQIMPKTGQRVFGVRKDELWNPRLNIQLGIDYLEQLYDQYGGRWDLALSHYNGGSLKGGSGASAKPHSYTRKYVSDVLRWKNRYREQAKVWRVANKASGNKSDDWTPAKTRVRDLRIEGSRHLPSNKKLSKYYPNIQSRPQENGDLNRWDANSSSEKSDFFVRLANARRSLDDFAPIVRWFPADKS